LPDKNDSLARLLRGLGLLSPNPGMHICPGSSSRWRLRRAAIEDMAHFVYFFVVLDDNPKFELKAEVI
jgi:hypothetical protein